MPGRRHSLAAPRSSSIGWDAPLLLERRGPSSTPSTSGREHDGGIGSGSGEPRRGRGHGAQRSQTAAPPSTDFTLHAAAAHITDRLAGLWDRGSPIGCTMPPELDGAAAVAEAWRPQRRRRKAKAATPPCAAAAASTQGSTFLPRWLTGAPPRTPPQAEPRSRWARGLPRRATAKKQAPGPVATPAPKPATAAPPPDPRLLDRASTYCRHLAAGAASCAVTRTVLAPLERIKLEQVLHSASGGFRATAASIFTSGGLAGFWAGNGLNLLRTCPHKALNFACFDAYRRALLAATGTPHFGAAERFGAGALAGMTATGLCFPLDVLRTRLMGPGALPGAGVLSTLRAMVTVEGAGSLYVGLAPALAATAPAGAVFYGTYDVVKEAYLRGAWDARGLPRPPRLAAAQTLAFGAVAGCAAELSIYPAEVVRRRMQLASMARARALAAAAAAAAGTEGAAAAAAAAAAATPAVTFRGAAAALLREQGVKGMYAGLGPNMLQVLPSAALSYYAYEVFKGLLSVE